MMFPCILFRFASGGAIEHIFALMKICEIRCRPQSTIFSALWTTVLIVLMKNLVFDCVVPHKMIKISVRIEIRVFQIVYLPSCEPLDALSRII